MVVIIVVDVNVADDDDDFDGGERNEGSSGVIANCILLTSSYTPPTSLVWHALYASEYDILSSQFRAVHCPNYTVAHQP